MKASTTDLLAVLDPLPHRGRLRHVAAWARTAPDRAEVCADLWAGGAYERHLALIAAMSTGDHDGILTGARDPSPRLRAIALGAALRAGLLTGRQGELSDADRRAVYRRLRRLRRPEVADTLLREVLERHGPGEAAAVLPACSAATVREMLPAVEHLVNLAALAARHPEVVLDRARRRLAAAEPRWRSATWYRLAEPVLRTGPDRALTLIEEFAPEDELPGDLTAYARIAAVHPHRVLALLTAPRRAAWLARQSLPPALLRRLAVLPTPDLAPVGRAFRDNGRALSRLLKALPPGRRGDFHDTVMADVDTSVRVPIPQVMDVLPAAVRTREARRMLTLPAIREREDSVWEWSAHLPWPEARAALEPALRSGDADDRSSGYALLVKAALRAREPEPVAEMLGRLSWLRNERDPVRHSALRGLAPAGRLLTAASVPDLTGIVTFVAEAHDTSPNTAASLGRLAGEVLVHHAGVPELAEWALSTMEKLAHTTLPSLVRLPHGHERLVFDRLRPWAAAALERGRPEALFALAYALGRRGHDLPGLQAMLRRCLEPGTLESAARTAITLWLDDPRARSQRVAEVLALDPTAATIPVVWRNVCGVRTDLLDVVLSGRSQGRFVPAGLRWVPATVECPERWLPRQQRRLVDLMERVVDDHEVPEHQRAAALRAAARVPEAGRELVLRHAGSPHVVLAEAALGSLIWTDRPAEALPVLLTHAGGDRARVALYAAGRAVRHIAPELLPGLLGPILTAPVKVTSRKETVRLLARFGPPSTMVTLRDAYLVEDQHRDVRAAIVSTARQHLENPVSWEILDLAVGGGSRSTGENRATGDNQATGENREEVRSVIAARALSIAEEHRPRYAALILGACRSADPEIRREAFHELPQWARWSGDITAVIVDRVTELADTLDGHDVRNLVSAAGSAWLATALDRLVALDTGDRSPGAPGADRPARRRIEALTRATTAAGTDDVRAELREPVRRLAARPAYRRVAVTTLINLGRLDDLDEIAALCAGRPLLAARAAETAGSRLRQLPDLITPGFLHPLIGSLTARGDLAGGLIAVSLTRLGATFGWARPWRDLLLALRDHPDEDVREEAYAVDMT